jgi:hypothetical protein
MIKSDVYTGIEKEVPLKEILRPISEYSSLYVPGRMLLVFQMEYYKDSENCETIRFVDDKMKIIRNVREELKDKVIHSCVFSYLENVSFSISGMYQDKDLLVSLAKMEGEIRFNIQNADVLRMLIENKGKNDRIVFEYYPCNNSQILIDAGLRSELLTSELQKPTKRGYIGFKPSYNVYLIQKVYKTNVQRDLVIPSDNPFLFWEEITNKE